MTANSRRPDMRLLIPSALRYARELATGANGSYREQLGYYYLALPRELGMVSRAVPIPFIPDGALESPWNVLAPLIAWGVACALRGETVVGLDGATPLVALGAWLVGFRPRSVFIQTYYVSGRPSRGAVAGAARVLRHAGLRSAAGILFMCEEQRTEAIDRLGLDPSRTATITIGVDTEFFRPSINHAVETTGIDEIDALQPGSYLFTCGEQLRRDDVLINALANEPITLVRLFKNEDKARDFHSWLARRAPPKLRVKTFVDVHPRAMKALYQKALCVVQPVDASWQPAGWHSFTEAVACGIPVVVADGLVAREASRLWRQLGNADPPPFETVPLEDVERFRQAVRDIMGSPEKVRSMSLGARRLAEGALEIDRCGREALLAVTRLAAAGQKG